MIKSYSPQPEIGLNSDRKISRMSLELQNQDNNNSQQYVEIKNMKELKQVQKQSIQQFILRQQKKDPLLSDKEQYLLSLSYQGEYFMHYGQIYKDKQLEEHLMKCQCRPKRDSNEELILNKNQIFNQKFKQFKENQEKYRRKLSEQEIQELKLEKLKKQELAQEIRQKARSAQDMSLLMDQKKRSILKQNKNKKQKKYSYDNQEDNESSEGQQKLLLENLKEHCQQKKKDSNKRVSFESDLKKLSLNYSSQNCRQLHCENNDISIDSQSESGEEDGSQEDVNDEINLSICSLECVEDNNSSGVSEENPSLQKIREFPQIDMHVHQELIQKNKSQ